MTVFSLHSPDHATTEIDLFADSPLDFGAAYGRSVRLDLGSEVSATFVGLDDLLALKRHAGRPAPPPLVGYLTCCVDEDGDAARQQAAAVIAFNSTVKTYQGIHEHHGFLGEVAAIRAAWKQGDFPGMVAAVSREMIDTIALAGTPQEVRDRYEERAAVYDDVLLWPPAFVGQGGIERVVRTMAPLVDPAGSKRVP